MQKNINRLIQKRAKHDGQFTQIVNISIDNMPDTVGYAARWLWEILLRLPPNFNPSCSNLAKRMRGKCNERSVRAYILELKEAGLLETETIAGQTIYTVYEIPKRMGTIKQQKDEET